jgi:hypothetical protein
MSLRWTADDGVQSATLVNGQLVTVKSSSLVPYFTLIYLGSEYEFGSMLDAQQAAALANLACLPHPVMRKPMSAPAAPMTSAA